MKKVTKTGVLKIINNTIDSVNISIEQINENLLNIGLDSISFIQMIVLLEDEFDCVIPDSKLSVQKMNTIQKILDVLNELYVEAANHE